MLKAINLLNFKRFFLSILSFIVLYALYQPSASALTYRISDSENVIGEYTKVRAGSADTLTELAQEYDIGVYEMVRANPHLSRKELKSSTSVTIPAQFTLPSGPREGIVLNLADMRVFYYHPNSNKVSTYPVGIGRQGWSTPTGSTRVVNKKKNPAWNPPASIRREAARKGKTLPAVVPAGPRNPLGQYALYLGFSGILMHGTNQPSSIGLRSSHGCIRMYPADIEELFYMAPVGTPVRVVYEAH